MALKRVMAWAEKCPEILKRHKDSDGRHPKLTFFYPEEEYDADILSALANLCHQGYGEVEVHLHHDKDTAEGLREKLVRFKKILSEKYGLLSMDKKTSDIKYGFIHGNWALDNSRMDGKWCGVNNELEVLKETGCYADFTLPSAPSDTQTKKINSIYYAIEDPNNPKSHNTGRNLEVGKVDEEDLMMIQGPLALNWKRGGKGIFPKIENGSITANNPVTRDRVRLWVNYAPKIHAKNDWIFIKVYTHGCQEENMDYLLSEGLDALFSTLERNYGDGTDFRLHYVTSREMFNIIKALEEGKEDSPGDMFDYRLVWTGKSQIRGKNV